MLEALDTGEPVACVGTGSVERVIHVVFVPKVSLDRRIQILNLLKVLDNLGKLRYFQNFTVTCKKINDYML